MKILLISGSPRQGNTEYILKHLFDKIECEKELILLRNQNIEHCKGCLNCHKTYKCNIKDDMKDIIEKMIESDLIIFGVPCYFDNVTSIFKTFIDRCRQKSRIHIHRWWKDRRNKKSNVRLSKWF